MEFLQTRRIFVAILALGLFAMAARSVTDPDVWWHLRSGQLIVQTHKVFQTRTPSRGSDGPGSIMSGYPRF
jgi:hypothetical protein